MSEWFTASFSGSSATPAAVLAWRIAVAMILGTGVAGLYRWARRGESYQPTFVTTLVLLAAAIAMATQVIGDNVARAFSLVGALSVVRFRTVVKDTQDTAFVIIAVVVGMSSGANHMAVGVAGLAVMAVASLFLWPRRRGDGWQATESTLTLRVPLAGAAQEAVERALATAATRSSLTSAATARQGSCLDLKYVLRLRAGGSPTALVAELTRLQGVENVDLSRGS